MPEYIEREKAIAICQNHYEYCLKMHDFSGDSVAYDIRANIQGLPTADVVEVVRCKDCEYGEADYGFNGDIINPFQYRCTYDGSQWNRPDHFCSDGIRKAGAEV